MLTLFKTVKNVVKYIDLIFSSMKLTSFSDTNNLQNHFPTSEKFNL